MNTHKEHTSASSNFTDTGKLTYNVSQRIVIKWGFAKLFSCIDREKERVVNLNHLRSTQKTRRNYPDQLQDSF